jgi:hypothetical protein
MFAVLFYLEGLHKTKFLGAVLAVGLICAAILGVFSSRLPWTIQRTLSFLPIKVDEFVKQDSTGSTTWRLEIWKEVLPDIPKYLIKGKGFTMGADDLWWMHMKPPDSHAGSIMANDFHSGPLSLLVPFGLFGVIGFVWLLVAGTRFLYRNFKTGDPAFKTANALLLAIFVARIIEFFLVFGAFYLDLFTFTGILGLSVSLNGNKQDEPELETEPAFAPFSSIADGKNSA